MEMARSFLVCNLAIISAPFSSAKTARKSRIACDCSNNSVYSVPRRKGLGGRTDLLITTRPQEVCTRAAVQPLRCCKEAKEFGQTFFYECDPAATEDAQDILVHDNPPLSMAPEDNNGSTAIAPGPYRTKIQVDNLRDGLEIEESSSTFIDRGWRFVGDSDFIVTNVRCEDPNEYKPDFAVRAGPRIKMVFKPDTSRAAIVTCGGLCPGLNNVIRSIVTTLITYGVEEIFGIKYGFKGFYDWGKQSLEPLRLNTNDVEEINAQGGTILGSSRGGSDIDEIVSSIKRMDLDMVFVIGGNGSHAGALAIKEGCDEKKMKCAIVGIPKTIDNDILMIDRTFGFDTAVEQAQMSIRAAAVEAKSAQRGVGVVKLMGRSSGFIAMHSTLASGEVDICLVPEVPFSQEELLKYVESVLDKQNHCVIVVAEGAGQDLMLCSNEYDASGNPVLADIGRYLCDRIKNHFKNKSLPISLKYLDPTYAIRACPANATDAIYCNLLGQHAVHAAFAGFTNVTVGLINNCYAYLPIPEVIKEAGKIDPRGRRWSQLVASTGQPSMMVEKEGLSNPQASSS